METYYTLKTVNEGTCHVNPLILLLLEYDNYLSIPNSRQLQTDVAIKHDSKLHGVFFNDFAIV